MTVNMEEFVRKQIQTIINDSASPEEAWDTVVEKFDDLGVSMLEDMGYSCPYDE